MKDTREKRSEETPVPAGQILSVPILESPRTLTHILVNNLNRLALDGHGRPAAYGGSDGGPQGLIPGLAETESFCCSPLRFPDARKCTVLE